jgi:hypothetical protein
MDQGLLRQLVTPARNSAAPVDLLLHVTIVYEDVATRQWAGEVCERVARLVGTDAVRCTWWKLSELAEPAVLAGAVSTALRADVLVVAVHAADSLPLPFYVWVDSWLPHRNGRTAALVTLIALPERPSLTFERTQDYLRATAREGQMDFLLEERRLTQTHPDSWQQASSHTTTADRGRLPKRAPLRDTARLQSPVAA